MPTQHRCIPCTLTNPHSSPGLTTSLTLPPATGRFGAVFLLGEVCCLFTVERRLMLDVEGARAAVDDWGCVGGCTVWPDCVGSISQDGIAAGGW
jgi:hypothetical protein